MIKFWTYWYYKFMNLHYKIICRVKYGPDSLCDNCEKRTYWNGNIDKQRLLCDNCWVKLVYKKPLYLTWRINMKWAIEYDKWLNKNTNPISTYLKLITKYYLIFMFTVLFLPYVIFMMIITFPLYFFDTMFLSRK